MPGRAELLAHHGVARAGPGQLVADEFLRRAVGIAHRGEVRLGLDRQVLGAEPGHGHPLDGIGKDVGQAEIVVVTHGHRLEVCRPLTVVARGRRAVGDRGDGRG